MSNEIKDPLSLMAAINELSELTKNGTEQSHKALELRNAIKENIDKYCNNGALSLKFIDDLAGVMSSMDTLDNNIAIYNEFLGHYQQGTNYKFININGIEYAIYTYKNELRKVEANNLTAILRALIAEAARTVDNDKILHAKETIAELFKHSDDKNLMNGVAKSILIQIENTTSQNEINNLMQELEFIYKNPINPRQKTNLSEYGRNYFKDKLLDLLRSNKISENNFASIVNIMGLGKNIGSYDNATNVWVYSYQDGGNIKIIASENSNKVDFEDLSEEFQNKVKLELAVKYAKKLASKENMIYSCIINDEPCFIFKYYKEDKEYKYRYDKRYDKLESSHYLFNTKIDGFTSAQISKLINTEIEYCIEQPFLGWGQIHYLYNFATLHDINGNNNHKKINQIKSNWFALQGSGDSDIRNSVIMHTGKKTQNDINLKLLDKKTLRFNFVMNDIISGLRDYPSTLNIIMENNTCSIDVKMNILTSVYSIDKIQSLSQYLRSIIEDPAENNIHQYTLNNIRAIYNNMHVDDLFKAYGKSLKEGSDLDIKDIRALLLMCQDNKVSDIEKLFMALPDNNVRSIFLTEIRNNNKNYGKIFRHLKGNRDKLGLTADLQIQSGFHYSTSEDLVEDVLKDGDSLKAVKVEEMQIVSKEEVKNDGIADAKIDRLDPEPASPITTGEKIKSVINNILGFFAITIIFVGLLAISAVVVPLFLAGQIVTLTAIGVFYGGVSVALVGALIYESVIAYTKLNNADNTLVNPEQNIAQEVREKFIFDPEVMKNLNNIKLSNGDNLSKVLVEHFKDRSNIIRQSINDTNIGTIAIKLLELQQDWDTIANAVKNKNSDVYEIVTNYVRKSAPELYSESESKLFTKRNNMTFTTPANPTPHEHVKDHTPNRLVDENMLDNYKALKQKLEEFQAGTSRNI